MKRLLQQYRFLFEELVSRDFKKKYKGTILGMGWSVVSPLLQLMVMSLVFSNFFGNGIAHYTIYLFCGNLVFSYFKEATLGGMGSLLFNASIFTKVDVPKYMFLFSKNVSALINFGLTLCVFFVFCLIDRITFSWQFLSLLFPVICLVVFNIGVGLILSALYVFFRDTSYLYDVFTLLLMYCSAIFYRVDGFSPAKQNIFLLNPIFVYIKYFRTVVLDGHLPSLAFHGLCLFYAVCFLGIGLIIYKKYNNRFLYYV